jgi:hypothetical protein
VNILDENIPKNQRQLLEGWRIHVRQIGFNIGKRGMQDEEIIPFLLQRRLSTFFSRDEGFYDRRLCHARYSLVYLAVDKNETAIFVRRVLLHPELDSQTKRMGKVVRASRVGVSVWLPHAEHEMRVGWTPESA